MGGTENSSSMVMAAAIVVTAAIVIFILLPAWIFLYAYNKWSGGSSEEELPIELPHSSSINPRRRRQFLFFLSQDNAPALIGLDPSILLSLPIVVFHPNEFNRDVDCAICLSQVEPGGKARFLPGCHHGFHVECIDMWFQSHATCPICRSQISHFLPDGDEDHQLGPPQSHVAVIVEASLRNSRNSSCH